MRFRTDMLPSTLAVAVGSMSYYVVKGPLVNREPADSIRRPAARAGAIWRGKPAGGLP
jgi:hypothetical protein